MRIEERALVKRFLNHVKTAVSIHGHSRNDNCVYVGGLHQSMTQHFVELVLPALPHYDWITDPELIPPGIRGQSPSNVVNLPPAKGMQLELPRKLRQTKPTPDGKGFEPTGDALVLSRLLIDLVDMLKD